MIQEPGPNPAAEKAETARAKKTRRQRVAGVVLMGVGGLSVLVAAGTGIAAVVQNNSSNEFCDYQARCTASGLKDRNTARAYGWASTISAVAGGALMGTGLVVFLTAPSSRKPQSASLRLGTGGVSIEGSF